MDNLRAGASAVVFPILLSLVSCSSDDDLAAAAQSSPMEALDAIKRFKDSFARSECGANCLSPGTNQPASDGTAWVRNPCDNRLQSRTENVKSRFSPDELPSTTEEPVTGTTASFFWNRSFGFDSSTGLNFLDVVLESAFSFSEVDKLEITLAVVDPVFTGFTNPIEVRRSICEAIESGKQFPLSGNVFVTGVVRARVRLSYKAFNSSAQEIKLSGSAVVLAVNARAGGEYVEQTEEGVNILQESPSGQPTIFSVELLDIPQSKQDEEFVSERILAVCGGGKAPDRVVIPAQVSGETVAVFRFEESDETTLFSSWSLEFENVTDRKISISYQVRVRNSFGRVIKSQGGGDAIFNPGDISVSTIVFPSEEDVRISESSIELNVSLPLEESPR